MLGPSGPGLWTELCCSGDFLRAGEGCSCGGRDHITMISMGLKWPPKAIVSEEATPVMGSGGAGVS